MESVLPRPVASWLRWSYRVQPRAVWIWALTCGLVLYLGIDGGGYDLIVRSDAAIIVWWTVLLGAAWGVLPSSRIGRAGWATLAILAAFVVWTAIASSWSLSSERSLEELSRVCCYLGVLALAVTSYGERRRALRHAVAAVASAIVVIVVLALLSRLRPGMFQGAQTTVSFLPGSHQRLSWPLNYWNALGALVALGLPLLIAIATSARSLAAQAAAAGSIPLLALCGYLTFSRGGAAASAVAVLAFIALAPERIPKLATIAAAAAGSAALIAGAIHRHAIEDGLTTAAARHQGATLIVAIVLVCAGVAVAQVGIGLAVRHGTPPRFLAPSLRHARMLLVGAVLVAAIAGVAAGAPHWLGHAWSRFKQDNTAALHQDTLARFGALSGNGRYTYWKTAVHALPGHVLDGYGPGSFQLVWLPRAPVFSYIENAHSLYVETLTEDGVIGLVLLGGSLLLLLGTAIARVVRSRFEDRAHAAAVAAACLAFTVSAAFDWVWQVPVLPVAMLLLAAAALLPVKRRGGEDPGRAAVRRGGPVMVRIGACVAAAASLVAIGVPLAETTALRQSQTAAAAGSDAVALADAQSAIRVEPGAASAQLQKSLVLELQGRYRQAVVAARAATADEPQNWQTWLVLVRVAAEAGQPRLAVAAYREARALNPRSPIFQMQ